MWTSTLVLQIYFQWIPLLSALLLILLLFGLTLHAVATTSAVTSFSFNPFPLLSTPRNLFKIFADYVKHT